MLLSTPVAKPWGWSLSSQGTESPWCCRAGLQVLFVAFVLGPFACGPEVETPGLSTWTVEREARFGGVDNERYAWTEIVGLTVGPWGRLYLSQWQVPSVWIYDSDGRYLGDIGQGGDGPGEFMAVGRTVWFRDTLWVMDGPMARVSLFDRQGRYLDRIHFSVPYPPSGSSIRPGHPLADGHLLSEPVLATSAVMRGGLERLPLLRVTREGEVRDTVAWKPLRRHFHRVEYRESGGYRIGRHPLPGSALHAVSTAGDAIYLADPEPEGTDGYLVTKLGLEGDTLWNREYSFAPVPVTEAYLESLVARRWDERTYLHDRTTEKRFRKAFLEGLDPPAHLPPITNLKVNTDGTFWLRREDLGADSVRWRVFAPDGEPLAKVEVPASVRVLALDGDEIWGVETGELDVPYLVRLGVRRGNQ